MIICQMRPRKPETTYISRLVPDHNGVNLMIRVNTGNQVQEPFDTRRDSEPLSRVSHHVTTTAVVPRGPCWCVCPLGCLDGCGYPGGQDVLNVWKFGSFDRKLTPRETGKVNYVSGQSKIDLGEISNFKW